jgi:CubicO group peptidase (beta-lactamase class C family)
MQRSDFIDLDDVQDDTAEGYESVEMDKKVVGWKRNIYLTTPAAASDGGSVSTAEDLMTFIDALRSGKLLSKEMTEKMLTPQVLDEGSNGARGYVWKYGYANWFILDDNDSIIRGGHTGEEAGVSARLYYYPSKEIDVVILANQGGCAGTIGWQIHNFIMEDTEMFNDKK